MLKNIYLQINLVFVNISVTKSLLSSFLLIYILVGALGKLSLSKKKWLPLFVKIKK